MGVTPSVEGTSGHPFPSHLLRALFVDDLRIVLRLLSVLPIQVDHQPAAVLLLAGVNVLNLVLPRPRRRAPLLLGQRRRRRLGVASVPSRSLRVRHGCPCGFPTTLLPPHGFFCLLKDGLAPADTLVIVLKNLVCCLTAIRRIPRSGRYVSP